MSKKSQKIPKQDEFKDFPTLLYKFKDFQALNLCFQSQGLASTSL
jgi:hypothetical protein